MKAMSVSSHVIEVKSCQCFKVCNKFEMSPDVLKMYRCVLVRNFEEAYVL